MKVNRNVKCDTEKLERGFTQGSPSNRAQQEWRSCRSSCGGILVDAAMPLHLMGIIRLMKKDAVVFPSYSSSPRQSHRRRTDPKCNPLGGPSHSDDWFSTSIPQAKKIFCVFSFRQQIFAGLGTFWVYKLSFGPVKTFPQIFVLGKVSVRDLQTLMMSISKA